MSCSGVFLNVAQPASAIAKKSVIVLTEFPFDRRYWGKVRTAVKQNTNFDSGKVYLK